MIPPEGLIQQVLVEHGISHFVPGEKALVTISGGLDSTVLLYLIRHLGLNPVGIQFHYATRPKAEEQALRRICQLSGTQLMSVRYPTVLDDSGTDLHPFVAEAHSIYYLTATNLAAVNGIRLVFGGIIRDDWEDSFGENCRDVIERINRLSGIEFGQDSPRLIMPFISIKKADVMRIGRFLDVPLHLTWSCEYDLEEPCGICGNCSIRIAAAYFDTGGIQSSKPCVESPNN